MFANTLYVVCLIRKLLICLFLFTGRDMLDYFWAGTSNFLEPPVVAWQLLRAEKYASLTQNRRKTANCRFYTSVCAQNNRNILC